LRNLQPGTSRFDSAFTNLAKAAADVLGKAGIANAPLFYGHVGEGELREALACCDAVKAGGAKSAACVLPGPPQSSTQRDELLKRLDVLLIEPHPGSGALVDEFKKTPGRPVMLLAQPSVFGTGFCAYGLGAEGVYVRPIFQDLPMFNAFWFDGRSLLLPDTPDNGLLPPFKQSLQPTLTLLQVQQGSQDLHLALWCEALAKAAKAKGLDASEMDKLLADIRAACAARPDNFEPDGLRSAAAGNQQTCDWRTGLISKAAKLSAALAAK
jgi:hypothetical protein